MTLGDAMANDGLTTTRSPIVETASGRLRGATSGGIHGFKGIPYGASTEGANRFMPAQVLFNAKCQVTKDPDRAARLVWTQVVAAQGQ
jgi:hypothetical protein